jgi:hypothetical protein
MSGFPVTPSPTAPPVPAPPPPTFEATTADFVYTETVTEYNQWGQAIITPIDPWDCATLAAAERFQAFLATQGLVLAIVWMWPIFPNNGNQAWQSAQVPGFQLPQAQPNPMEPNAPPPPPPPPPTLVGPLIRNYLVFGVPSTSTDIALMTFGVIPPNSLIP